jgi:hypothetical protein
MADNCTVICYLRSPKDETLEKFPDNIKWNSKKWRMLLFFSQDREMIFAGRQYPFSTDAGLKMVLDQLLFESGIFREIEPARSWQEIRWAPWSSKRLGDVCLEDGTIISYGEMIPLNREIVSIYDLIKTCSTPLFFNDLLHSSSYTSKYTYKVRKDFGWKSILTTPKQTRFKIGENVKCLCCGQTDASLSDSVYCVACDLKYGHSENEDVFTYCERCGDRITFDDAMEIGDEGAYWCKDCFEEHARECRVCGNCYDISEFVFDDEDDDDEIICRWCKIDIKEELLWHEEMMQNNK